MHLPTTDTALPLPETAEACEAAIGVLRDEIRSIQIRLATTDMRRQAERAKPDADAYHRASTALRLKLRALDGLRQHLRGLERARGGSAAARRAAFKDLLIEVLRHDVDATLWHEALARARALHHRLNGTGQEVDHG